jgi:hypothetical protein
MPPPDSSAAPSCAAFATLPDKNADGCYTNGYELGVDYASKLVARRDCRSSDDGRERHYAVAVTTTGHDIPMLSSEYFLLYGPGASFLGRGDRAPAPPRSVQKYELPSDIRVYVDVISNQVLRAFQGDRRIDPPRLAMLDCIGDDFWHSKLDNQNLSAFYLRPHKRSDLVTQCTPFVSLYWESDGGAVRPSSSVFLDPGYGGWNPGEDWEGFRNDFDLTGPMVTLEGMRPAARVLLTTVIPVFSDAGANKDLGGRLDRIAEDLRPYDEPLAAALQAMMAAQPGGVRRAPPNEDSPKGSVDSIPPLSGEKPAHHKISPSSGSLAGLDDLPFVLPIAPLAFKPLELAGALAVELKSHPSPPPVDSTALIAAMLNTLAPAKDDFYGSALPRLAHLAAAAQAELALIEEAKTSPQARRLLAQLETIKTCERGLY